MRRLVLSMVLGVAASACGDDGGNEGNSDTGGNAGATEANYPDSLCTEAECKKGGCDGDGSDDAMPDCNAWQILGKFSFQAAVIDAGGTPGFPERPMRSDEDLCPPNTSTPASIASHCCQNVFEQPSQPAYRLTALRMTTPPIFGGSQVSSTNRDAIEDDRYNWVMSVSSKEDGDVVITSGLGLQNADGSFQLVGGEFELGGETWNEDGAWDPHLIPATLITNDDGSRKLSYKGQYIPDGRSFELPMWGPGYDFTMLVLSMSGLEMTINLSEDLLCGGYLTGPGSFDMIGELTAYLPLEPLRDAKLHFKKDDSGIALCPLTAQIKSCDGPVTEW